MSPLLSLCVPVYNGYPHIETLLNGLSDMVGNPDFECTLVDDGSDEQTKTYLKHLENKYPNIKVVFNDHNLGMDLNFEKSVTVSSGKYLWFSGQDDQITSASVGYVIDVLKKDPSLDFLFLNYNVVDRWNKNEERSNCLHIQADMQGTGYESFFSGMDYTLPTFLPTYILRREVWNSFDRSVFYKTHYIQAGVFLLALPTLRWKVLAKPLILGYIPEDGWQSDMVKRHMILLGHIEMLGIVKEKITDPSYKRHLNELIARCFSNLRNAVVENAGVKDPKVEQKIRKIIPFYSFNLAKQFYLYALLLASKLGVDNFIRKVKQVFAK